MRRFLIGAGLMGALAGTAAVAQGEGTAMPSMSAPRALEQPNLRQPSARASQFRNVAGQIATGEKSARFCFELENLRLVSGANYASWWNATTNGGGTYYKFALTPDGVVASDVTSGGDTGLQSALTPAQLAAFDNFNGALRQAAAAGRAVEIRWRELGGAVVGITVHWKGPGC